jgi:hypothetical protein
VVARPAEPAATGWRPAAGIDWAAPWLLPYAELGRPLAERSFAFGVADALRDERPAGRRFVPHQALPPDQAYEQFIDAQGAIPTRENAHDFFNALVWLHLPQAKRRMNQLQAGEIRRAGIGARRGPLRDALTLLDENGAILQAPRPLWNALRARDWRRLLVGERSLWQQARLQIVGHALLEQLLIAPRKSLTAHVLLAPEPSGPSVPAGDDRALAEALDPRWLATKPFTPLPVLGVPGWCAQNQNFCFYDDSDVFRPRRPTESRTTHAPADPRTA